MNHTILSFQNGVTVIRATKIVVLILFVTVVAAGCGGRQAATSGGGSPATPAQTTTTSPDSNARTVDVCKWFTQADAETLLQASVEVKGGGGGYGLGGCTYTSGGKVAVDIDAGSAAEYDGLVAKFEDAEKISGVGQDAIWVAFVTTLDVKLNDDYFVAVKVSNGDKELAIEIGKKVAAAAGA